MAKKVVADLLGILQVYSDGSTVRTGDPIQNFSPSHQEWGDELGVSVKDVAFDEILYPGASPSWVRLYLPAQHTNNLKLPVIIYFHGGGFCGSFLAESLGYHRVCLKWAAEVGAIVVAANYRVAPEHRLPAAYDDCMAALEWIRLRKDKWVNLYADFANVHLMGDSAGGNIVHHVMTAIHKDVEKWKPLQIKGAIMLQPFFGSEERTKSEINCPLDAFLGLEVCDWFWKLALPAEADRNHPFCNPLGEGGVRALNSANLPKVMVVIGGRDLLRDKELEYCKAMKSCGNQIEVVEFEEEEHAFYTIKLEGESSLKLIARASLFIKSADMGHHSKF
uniref:TSA: Wollemia nobilis Ref_Wollemi_Transcript_14071_1299 transcribed RNA sequence n=1 Tax=Wollemia nobilis TaxID=56998 RepID=A0A0C9QQ70_9CONI